MHFSFYTSNNGNPTVKSIFSGSGYTTRLLRRPPDVCTCCKFTMSFVNRKLLSANFDSPQLYTPNGFRRSLVLRSDPENKSTAVENLLLSSIQAKICNMAYPLPVNGRNLRFPSYSDVGQSSPSLFVLPDRKNMRIAIEISLLSCNEAEIYTISSLLPVNGRHL